MLTRTNSSITQLQFCTVRFKRCVPNTALRYLCHLVPIRERLAVPVVLACFIFCSARRGALDDCRFVVLPKFMGDAFISNDQLTARVPSFDGDRDILWEHFTKAVPSPAALAHKKLTLRQNRIF